MYLRKINIIMYHGRYNKLSVYKSENGKRNSNLKYNTYCSIRNTIFVGGGLVDSIVPAFGINICRRHSVGKAGVFPAWAIGIL